MNEELRVGSGALLGWAIPQEVRGVVVVTARSALARAPPDKSGSALPKAHAAAVVDEFVAANDTVAMMHLLTGQALLSRRKGSE